MKKLSTHDSLYLLNRYRGMLFSAVMLVTGICSFNISGQIPNPVTLTVNALPRSASISVAGEQDYYSFTNATRTNGTYTIQTYGSRLNTYMYLYRLDGSTPVLVTEDNDDGIGTNASITWTVPAGATRYVRVRAYSSTAVGSYYINVVKEPYYQPPRTLAGTAGPDLVTLSWSAPWSETLPTQYNIYRCASESGTYTEITQVIGSTSVTLTQNDNTTYWYYVTAEYGTNESGRSNIISVTPIGVPILTIDQASISASISNPGEEDWYKFFLTYSDELTLTAGGSQIDMTMYVYESDKTTLVVQDENTDPYKGASLSRYFPGGSKWYYIKVKAYPFDSATGSYSISVGTVVGVPSFGLIVDAIPYKSSIYANNTTNLYRIFTGTSAGIYTMQTYGSLDTRMTLYDGSPYNPVLETDENDGEGSNALISHALVADKAYFLAVTASGYGDYSIDVKGPGSVTPTRTLGNTTVYSSTSSQNYRRAIPVTFTEAGTIQSVSVYHNGGSGGVMLGVYSDASSTPSSRLGVTSSATVNSTAGWQTIPLTSPVSVTSGQTVWLAWVFQTSPGIRYTTGTPARAQSTATWSGGMPATFGTAAYANYKYSVYCTYTPGGTTPVLNVSPTSISLGSASGSSGTFTVTSNTSWSITDTGSWLSVSPLEGSNNGTITVTATSANTGTSSRSATVTVSAGSLSRTVTVTQEGQSTGTKTLGNTTVYSSVSSNVYRKAVPVTFSEAGTISSLSIYHNGGTGQMLMGVYSDASSAPSSRLGVTASTGVNATAGWQTISLTSPVAVTSGQTVWLAWVFETTVGCRYTSGTPAKAQSTATWSGGMPSAFGTAAFANVIYSVYCTYTPGTITTKTLGNTTVYSSVSSNVYRKAVPVTFSEAGSISSLSIYHNGGTGQMLMGVYSDASSAPSSRLGVTASTGVNATAGWQTISLTSPVAVTSGQTVWLAWVFETTVGCRYTSGTPAKAQSTATWSGGMPSAFGTAAFANVIYSVYCTYTPGQLKSGGIPAEGLSEENVREGVMIYPNPTDGIITVSWENSYEKGLTLTIYNLAGTQVKTVQVKPQVSEVNIDLSDSRPGVYLLMLKDTGSARIIKTTRLIRK